jgi:hypothetical protein
MILRLDSDVLLPCQCLTTDDAFVFRLTAVRCWLRPISFDMTHLTYLSIDQSATAVDSSRAAVEKTACLMKSAVVKASACCLCSINLSICDRRYSGHGEAGRGYDIDEACRVWILRL